MAFGSWHGNSRVRIVIADDHILVAEALKHLLEPEFQVVGIAPDGGSLLGLVLKLQPQIVILDISSPELNGLDAGERIKAMKRGIKLIYLTGASSEARHCGISQISDDGFAI
jgi:DNA-binding NarL/FixJ family response regulator